MTSDDREGEGEESLAQRQNCDDKITTNVYLNKNIDKYHGYFRTLYVCMAK